MDRYLTQFLPASAQGADGKWDLRDYMKTCAIGMDAGESAVYDPKENSVALTLKEESMDSLELAMFGCTGIPAAYSRTERLRIKWSYWTHEQKIRLRERLGLPPLPP